MKQLSFNRANTPYTDAELRGDDLRGAGVRGGSFLYVLEGRKAHNERLQEQRRTLVSIDLGAVSTPPNLDQAQTQPQHLTQENQIMTNHSLNVRKALLALMNDYTTVQVDYQFPLDFKLDRSGNKAYTYLLPLSLQVQVGDVVIVPVIQNTGSEVRTSFKMAQVVKVDDQPELNLDLAGQYGWVVQKVDWRSYHARLELETTLAEELAKMERANLRKNMLAGLTEQLGAEAMGAICNRLGRELPREVLEAQPIPAVDLDLGQSGG